MSRIIISRLKCNQEKIAPFIFPEVSHFNMLFSGVYLANPEKENEQCEMISVNLCYVEYPSKSYHSMIISRACYFDSYVRDGHSHHCSCHYCLFHYLEEGQEDFAYHPT